nr:hypothetical protein [Tanacetum cinerariifolium]
VFGGVVSIPAWIFISNWELPAKSNTPQTHIPLRAILGVLHLVPNPSEFEDEHSHHFNVESNLIESLLNQDSLISSSSKIDSLLDEFADELIFLKSIPPGIDEADCDLEEEIHLIEKLLNNWILNTCARGLVLR